MNDLTKVQLQLTRRNIISNIATLFTSSAIAQLFTTITFILTARILGPQQYGQFTASMTLALFCSIIFSLGLNIWMLREGGRDPSQIGNIVGSILTVKVILSILFFITIIALANVLEATSFPHELLVLCAFIIWFQDLIMTGLTGFKAILWNKISSSVEVTLAIVLLLITTYLIFQNASQVAIYIKMRVAVYLIGFVCIFGLIWYFLKIRSTWETVYRALINSPPYATSEFFAWLYMRVDVLIIAFILNDYAVGVYAPAASIITALYLLPTAINVVFVPVLSNLFNVNIIQGWHTAKRLVIFLAIVGIALFIFTYFGSQYLTILLGPSYSGSQDVLQILSIILLFHSISFGLAAILVATNQQKQRSIIQAVTVVFNLGMNIIVIRWLGIYGVAYVYVITEIILLVGYGYLVIHFRRSEISRQTLLRSRTG